MRTVIWFTYFWLYQLVSLPKYFILKSKLKKNQNITGEVHKVSTKWARSLMKVTGSTIEVCGEENIPTDGPVVFIANHQSNFDIPLMIGYINKPKGFIAKKETEGMPIVGYWMKFMQCIFLDRKDPRAAVRTIKQGVEIVKSGQAMVIFPEGTRSETGQLGEFKPGSFKLGMKAGAKVLPVTIDGTFDIMRKGSSKIKPASVKLTISKAIDSSKYESNESHLLREEVFEIIKSNL